MGKGQLLFKGDKNKKKKKTKSKHSKKKTEETSIAVQEEPTSFVVASTSKRKAESETPTVRKGTGKITTSGTVVTGYDTVFEKELSRGDAIMCVINGENQMRIITMRLSNQSLNLSSAFGENLKIPQMFQYIQKPRDVAKEKQDVIKKQKEASQDLQQLSFGLYSNKAFVYREKTETGSYRIKREQVSGTNSRVDLLNMRSKKTNDKYC